MHDNHPTDSVRSVQLYWTKRWFKTANMDVGRVNGHFMNGQHHGHGPVVTRPESI